MDGWMAVVVPDSDCGELVGEVGERTYSELNQIVRTQLTGGLALSFAV